jgi:hypothetical protein
MRTLTNAYDIPDEDILTYAYEAGIGHKLEEKWRESHTDRIDEALREYGVDHWDEAGRKLRSECQTWMVKEARERFAGGLELPGYGDDDEDLRGAA